jgi:Tol biopolymer transport system component
MRDRKLLVTMVVALVAAIVPAAANARTSGFAFQPIAIQRINLPSGIKSAGWPVFTHDGKHLLFFSTGANTTGGSTGPGSQAELWIVDADGRDAHCLSCGLANDPTSAGEGEITPFPDGKRIFFGSFNQPGASTYGVLQCEPSVADCASRKILPIDFSPAQPKVIPPGGAESTAQTDSGGDYGAKLSQDGEYVGFSDIRSDSIETMIIGKLELSGDEYIVTDPKVINPPGPSSASDKSVQDWSNGGSLYEFKTFTHGGADATYVQVGGEVGGNPDVWSVNLKTGKRTRLTANPDYDEDNAGSPNGSLMALWSNRTMHMTDWLDGMLPVRGFIDDPAAVLSLQLSSSNKRCHGPIWILPSTGDDDARLLGQPIVYYRVPHVFVTNNLTGWPQWSPNGRMLALNTTNNSPGSGYPAHAPFLLVAHFTATKATPPLRAVSSEPGSWALSPTQYHTDYGFSGTVTLHGLRGGTVTVAYGHGDVVLAGHWSETYDKYSDNGRDFVSGTVTITSSTTTGTLTSHLVMTGADTGSDNVDLTFGTGVTGHGESTYDGHTVSGPSPEQAAEGACPGIQPKEPHLHATARKLRDGHYRLKVTVSIADAGANEASVATEPVDDATIKIGHTTTHTNALGEAVVAAHTPGKVSISAGDTLVPTSIRLSSRH